MTEDCLFCKIAGGLMAAEFVLETKNLVVINDINPQAPVHMLVIPKKHYRSILDVDDPALLSEVTEAAVSAAKGAGIAEKGFRLVVNTNEEGGQTVFHLHMHILAGRPLSGHMG